MTGSLFDPVCPENLESRVEYILDQEKHHELFTEDYGKARFGAFWTDYVFIMTPLLEAEGEPYIVNFTLCAYGGGDSSQPVKMMQEGSIKEAS